MLKPSAKLSVAELSRPFWQQRVERYEAERDAWTANPKQRELEEIEADIAHARQHLTANPRGDERGTTMETDNAR